MKLKASITTLSSNQHTSIVTIFAIYFLLKALQHFFFLGSTKFSILN